MSDGLHWGRWKIEELGEKAIVRSMDRASLIHFVDFYRRAAVSLEPIKVRYENEYMDGKPSEETETIYMALLVAQNLYVRRENLLLEELHRRAAHG